MREIQQNRPQPPYQGYPVQPQPGAPYPQQPVQNPQPPMQQMQADGRTAGQRPQRQGHPEQRSKKQKAEKKFRKAQCPYCGKTINPLKSWLLKNQGEYICKKCGGRSNIVLDPAIYMLAFGAVAIDIIIFLIFALFVRHFNVPAQAAAESCSGRISSGAEKAAAFPRDGKRKLGTHHCDGPVEIEGEIHDKASSLSLLRREVPLS